MKNLFPAFILLGFAFLFSCGGEKKSTPDRVEVAENLPQEPAIPGDREFSPFNIGDKPVNGKNLSEQLHAFYTEAFSREIAVIIAPDFGYLQKGIDVRLNEMGVRGEYGPFGMRRSFDDPVSNLEKDYKGKFLVFKGKLWYNILEGMDVRLLDAFFVSAYKGEKITQLRKQTWESLSVTNPVLPGELIQLVSPLKGVVVTLTDKLYADEMKNYVRVRTDPEGTDFYISCNFADREEIESLVNGRAYTIRGEINDIDVETGHVWLIDCELVK
ncbi:MAG: hypothetical protein JW801_19385 [Bacteroidales bacterium]|nr:hypothetical protein [Bacteroidales bacterium]